MVRIGKKFYLICTNDRLQTAFFCGTAAECAKVLDCSLSNFREKVSAKRSVIDGYFHIEKVCLEERV